VTEVEQLHLDEKSDPDHHHQKAAKEKQASLRTQPKGGEPQREAPPPEGSGGDFTAMAQSCAGLPLGTSRRMLVLALVAGMEV